MADVKFEKPPVYSYKFSDGKILKTRVIVSFKEEDLYIFPRNGQKSTKITYKEITRADYGKSSVLGDYYVVLITPGEQIILQFEKDKSLEFCRILANETGSKIHHKVFIEISDYKFTPNEEKFTLNEGESELENLPPIFIFDPNSQPDITQYSRPSTARPRGELVEAYGLNRQLDAVEGMWVAADNSYEIVLTRNSFGNLAHYDFEAIFIDSRNPTPTRRIAKTVFVLKKTATDRYYSALFPMMKGSPGATFVLENRNLMAGYGPNSAGSKIVKTYFIRTYPPDESETEGIAGTGTGFFITPDLVATNFHVVENSKNLWVYLREIKIEAIVVLRDKRNDLAILRIMNVGPAITGSIRPIPIVGSDTVKNGEVVYTIGFPVPSDLGKRPKVSQGIINSLSGWDDDPRLFQISIPVQPGNSGGPLLNTRGEAIGVVTSTVNVTQFYEKTGVVPQNINYAMKSDFLTNLTSMLPDEVVASRNPYANAETSETAETIAELYASSVVLVVTGR